MLGSGWLHSPWFSWYCTRYFVTSVESVHCCCHWMFTERLLIITDSKFTGLFGGSRQQYTTQCHNHHFISFTYLVETIMLEMIKTWGFRSSGTWYCVVRSVGHDVAEDRLIFICKGPAVQETCWSAWISKWKVGNHSPSDTLSYCKTLASSATALRESAFSHNWKFSQNISCVCSKIIMLLLAAADDDE